MAGRKDLLRGSSVWLLRTHIWQVKLLCLIEKWPSSFSLFFLACLVPMGNYSFKTMRTVKEEFTAKEENTICQFVQQVFVDNLAEVISFFRTLLSHILQSDFNFAE